MHQPYRVRRYRMFDIGANHDYFSANDETDLNNERILRKVARKSYRPAGEVFSALLRTHPEFKFAISITGTLIEQLEKYDPFTLKLYQDMVNTGRVEIVGETYYHSLASLYSMPEFVRQVRMHRDMVQRVFGVVPRVFRNTELVYTNHVAEWADRAGYKGILAEGWDGILQGRSPAFLYQPTNTTAIKALLKHYKLSDDVAFRFGDTSWVEHPVTADKFAHWVHAHHGNGNTVNLFMDYETFGEHQWADKGIFDFMRHLPQALLAREDTVFMTPSETVDAYPTVDSFDVPGVLTWADTERDLSAWVGNDIQRAAIEDTYSLEEKVLRTYDQGIIDDWRKLQTSDHFYYMCTKYFNDGDVHAYFNPYDSPYEAYIAHRNALEDLKWRIDRYTVR
jgi:alpha-amylase